MNRCEGCSGRGYVGTLRANSPPCQVCRGTGRGHVHSWSIPIPTKDWEELVDGVLPAARVLVRRCDCGEYQVTHPTNVADYPKAYRATADVDWVPVTESERREISAMIFRGIWKP